MQYESLLSVSNSDLKGNAPQISPPDLDDTQATQIARLPRNTTDSATGLAGLGLDVHGALAVETDSGLVPSQFRPNHGMRVFVCGRWIVDAGHNNFVTEIHPPLLLATAEQIPREDGTRNPDETFSRLVTRPFLVSQDYSTYEHDVAGPLGPTQTRARALREELDYQLGKAAGLPNNCGLAGIFPIAPCLDQAQIHPKLLRAFNAPYLFHYVVRPRAFRKSPADRLLVRASFTVRRGVHVGVAQTLGSDEIDVYVSMNPFVYVSAPVPPTHVETVTLADLLNALSADKAQAVVDTLNDKLDQLWSHGYANNANNLYDTIMRGVQMDVFAAPVASNLRDNDNKLDNVSIEDTLVFPNVVDDSQPFPAYGYIAVSWERR